jgi:hypothetical protein
MYLIIYSSELTDKLQPLFERSWFQRMWTVQEVTIPPLGDITMHCGDVSMPFPYLYFFVRVFVKKHLFTCNKIRHAMELQEIILGEFQALHRAREMDPATEELIESLTAFNFAYILRLKLKQGAHLPNAKITPILAKARFKLSTDAKDKVFALHGVFDYLNVQIPPPDYGKSVENVYTEATVAAITFDKTLDILLQCSSEKRHPHLPSWVPDFSVSSFLVEDPRDPSEDVSRFNTSQNMLPQWKFSLENKITIRGRIVDVVVSRLPSFSPSTVLSHLKDIDLENFVLANSDPLVEMHEIFEVLQSWVQSCADEPTYPNGEPLQTALYRTILNDLEAMNKLAQKNNAFATWHRIMMASDRDRLEMIVDSQERRRLDKVYSRIDESPQSSILKSLVSNIHFNYKSSSHI